MLASECGLSLDTSQIIFMLPPLTDWDICLLRALFLEAEWMTAEEDESKLMLVPFIETHVNNLQMFSMTRRPQLRREEKNMQLYVHLLEEKDEVIYTVTCFKMQCAKELVALSRRLASSDFLLVPSVLSSRSVCLPTTDEALLVTVKEIITDLRNNYTTRNGIELNDEDSRYDVSELAIQLSDMLHDINLHASINFVFKKYSRL